MRKKGTTLALVEFNKELYVIKHNNVNYLLKLEDGRLSKQASQTKKDITWIGTEDDKRELTQFIYTTKGRYALTQNGADFYLYKRYIPRKDFSKKPKPSGKVTSKKKKTTIPKTFKK